MATIWIMVVFLCLVNAEEDAPVVRSLLSDGRGGPTDLQKHVMTLEFDEDNIRGTSTERLRIAELSKKVATDFVQMNPLNSDPAQLSHVGYLIIGDWGGKGRAVTPDYIQTLQSMKQFIADQGADLNLIGILNTGDNFYDIGITSLDDPLIHSIFKAPFTEYLSGEVNFDRNNSKIDLGDVGFFGVLGNHDHGNKGGWMHQIQLTHQEYIERDAQHRRNYPQWIIPDLWYAKRVRFGAKIILFLFFDTMILDKVSRDNEYQYKQMQINWFTRMFRENEGKVDHIFIIGHHPPFCTAKWNGNDNVLGVIKGIMKESNWFYKRITFIGGHDHTFEGGTAKDDELYLYNFVAGGTRDCSPNACWIADVLTGRAKKHVEHSESPIHRSYAQNVWSGCVKGGFGHLDISSDVDVTKIVIKMSFYSGENKKLITGTYKVRTRGGRRQRVNRRVGRGGRGRGAIPKRIDVASGSGSSAEVENDGSFLILYSDPDEIKWTYPVSAVDQPPPPPPID
eukprot:491734_1